MSSIPPQFPLSVRAWPTKDDKGSALPTLISRINAERGEFRHLTEADLEDEIAKAEIEPAAAHEHGETEDEEEEEEEEAGAEPDRIKEVMDARNEMLAQIDQAHHASMVALDFVALLLSKDQPVQASLSISEGLRQMVSLGTLGADRVKDSRLTAPRKADNATTGRGWKIQAFDHSVDSILAAATRLETEIDVETKYWEEILAVDQKGWKTCKLPQERHTLGVRFGFFEAAPAFRNRSLAALRRNSNGTVYLDQGIADATPKRVMIRVETDGAITGQLAPSYPVADDAPLESLILRARNIIFEEELWQELNREARTLANHNVRWASGAITVQLSASTRILLSLTPLSPSPPTPDPAPRAHTHDDTAELISLSLHLLLLHAHRQTLRRRSQPPPPLSHRPRPTPPYPLLRPLLARLHHESTISTLLRTTTSLSTTLRSASLPLPPPTLTIPNPPPPPSPLSAAESTIDALISHLEAELLIPLTAAPLPPQRATVRLRTELSLQTRFQVALDGAVARVARPPPNPGTVGEVVQFVLWAAGCALGAGFAEVQGGGGADEGLRGWEATAIPGVVRKADGGRRMVKEVGFVVEEGEGEGVRVVVRIRDGVKGEEGAREVVWDGRGEGRGLGEVVEEVGRWRGERGWGEGYEVEAHVVGID